MFGLSRLDFLDFDHWRSGQHWAALQVPWRKCRIWVSTRGGCSHQMGPWPTSQHSEIHEPFRDSIQAYCSDKSPNPPAGLTIRASQQGPWGPKYPHACSSTVARLSGLPIGRQGTCNTHVAWPGPQLRQEPYAFLSDIRSSSVFEGRGTSCLGG